MLILKTKYLVLYFIPLFNNKTLVAGCSGGNMKQESRVTNISRYRLKECEHWYFFVYFGSKL